MLNGKMSLRTRLTLTYILIVALCTVTIGTYLLGSLESFFLKLVASRLLSECRTAAGLLTASPSAGSPQSTKALISHIGRSGGSRVTLISPSGVVLADSAQDPDTLDWHGDREEIIEAMTTGYGQSIRYSTSVKKDMMYVAIRLTEGPHASSVLRVAIPLTEVREEIVRLRKIIASAILFSSALALAAGLWLARGITRPIETITAAAHAISRGDFSRSIVTMNDTAELSVLAQSFNQMAFNLRQTIESLSQAKSRLEAVLGTMVSGVMFMDAGGKVSLVNEAARRIFGIPPSFEGKPYEEVLRNYALSEKIAGVMESGEAVQAEVSIVYPKEKTLDVCVTPMSNGSHTGVVVVFHDITELKRLEKARSDFVANISHELKTPITSVKGFAETLLDGALNDPSSAREFIEIIFRESSRLDALVKDLADLSYLESSQKPLQTVFMDLREPVGESVRKATLRASAAGIVVTSHLPGTPVMCSVDPVRMEQVMDNLLDNALKFTPGGGNIDIFLDQDESSARIAVRDNGPGIPEADLPRIFERLYRVDKARSRKAGGTGLGLSIVKHIVEAHGGRVWAESQYGNGSTFHVVLPKSHPLIES